MTYRGVIGSGSVELIFLDERPWRAEGRASVNGQVVVPAGGQVGVPTLRVDQRFLAAPPLFGAGFAHAVGVAFGDDDVVLSMKDVQIWDGRGQLWPDTDPASVGPALDSMNAHDGRRRWTVQFNRPMPRR